MVVSKLSKNINYAEKMRLDSEDIDHNATSYNVNIKDFDLLIAIGKEKYTYINKNVIYFPIYLIKDERVFNQIGIYEIYSHKLPNILDEDGDIDLDELGDPLLYSFVDKKYLEKFDDSYDSDETDETDSVESEEEKADSDDESEDAKEIIDLTKDESKDNQQEKIKDRFLINKSAIKDNEEDDIIEEEIDEEEQDDDIADNGLWIQKYMKDQRYDIVDTVTNGDCFFDAIRLALEQREGESTTVKKLRKIVSDNITDDIFEQYKINYNMIFESIKENESQMRKINSTNRKLKKTLQSEKDRNKQLETIEEGKKYSEQFKEYKKQNELSKELMKDFYFMKDITNTQQLKDFVLKSEYYADTLAISIIERELKIKLILLSFENYVHADLNNVILCGQLNDDKLSKQSNYSPKYYIILQFEGLHYKLIIHNSKTTFSFKELPNKLKNKIYEKCCENSRGPFGIIEDFQKMRNKDDIEDLNDDEKIDSIEINSDLFDEDVVFQYYEKSSNKPIPGKGPGEKISLNKIKDFTKLQSILNWRKQLSNQYEKEFELDEKKWLSVEHFMNANKYKNNKDIYDNLSLTSGSDESRDILKMKEDVKKLTKDKDYDKRHDDLLKRAIKAKFSQNDDLQEMLKETKMAKLVNYRFKKQPATSFELMKYRKTILNK
tara:strand:- start:2100 stop:4088 length:1989 start_codon:yes stop_codon:yes gene_type:complete